MRKRFIIYSLCTLLTGQIFLCSFSRGYIPLKINFRASGDTASFTPNTNGGWSILSVYLNQDTPDSVEFELILKQATGHIKGSNEQLVGTITNKLFLPHKDQKVGYSLLPGNTWYLIIKESGQCYLAQVQGSGIEKSNMPGNPDIFPIKVRYKNN
jgi:hypothetical protein